MRVNITAIMLLGASAVCSSAVSAKESSIAVSFSGMLVDAAACSIEANQPIQVSFGNQVVVEKIDGLEYQQAIAFRLNCSQLNSTAMRLRIQGSATQIAGRTVLDAGKNGLGIALYRNRSNMSPNVWYSFTYPNPPTLTAAPIKNSTANLELGSFAMTATLTIEYQ